MYFLCFHQRIPASAQSQEVRYLVLLVRLWNQPETLVPELVERVVQRTEACGSAEKLEGLSFLPLVWHVEFEKLQVYDSLPPALLHANVLFDCLHDAECELRVSWLIQLLAAAQGVLDPTTERCR